LVVVVVVLLGRLVAVAAVGRVGEVGVGVEGVVLEGFFGRKRVRKGSIGSERGLRGRAKGRGGAAAEVGRSRGRKRTANEPELKTVNELFAAAI
jgi:hypothetical protein